MNDAVLILSVCIFQPPGAKRMKLSQSVVCFSRLPPGKEMEEEVLEIAEMFGEVRHSKFTEDKVRY